MPDWTKEQKDAITKKGSNIIVSAGAGSGKTAVLTERVITKLKEGVKINELLILTFTNAAAKEMQDRIREEINKYPSLKDNNDLLEISYITTFDSYTLSLVKKYNYLLNVSKDLSIADDSILTIKKQEILNKVIDDMYLTNDPLFQKLIKDFCLKNDNLIRDTLFNFIKHIDNELDRDNFLNNYITTYLNDDLINNYITEYLNLIYTIINNIENNIYLLANSSYPTYYEELVNTFNNLIYAKNYDDIYNYTMSLNVPRRPKGSDEIKDIKENIDNLVKELKSYLNYSTIEEIKESFNIIKDYLKVFLNIFKQYYLLIDEYKFNHDLYEFSDIAKMAIKLLKDNQDIQLELKNYYQEIMIDEYQDTNNMQEEFVKLIENNNIYMVGDIKQSIYGFRNANPSLFKMKYDNYSLNKGGIKIDLLKNFRSRKEVIEAINLIFSHIMDDYLGGCNYKKEHQMNYGNHMYDLRNKQDDYKLEILNYDNNNTSFTNEEIESFIIGKDILNKINNHYEVIDKKTKLLRPVNYNDFCIIMDRGSSFKTYKKVFEYLKIPLNLYMDRTLTNEKDILVLANLISLILKIKEKKYDEEFKYYFVSIARSFLFNYDDNTIFNIIKDNTYYTTNIYTICSDIIKEIPNLDVYETLKLIITKIDYYNKIITISNVEDILIRLDNLFNIANNLSNIGYTLEDFNTYLQEIIKSKNEIKYSVNDTNDNAVKIMNIHKSKGLEFPLCYFSGLYKKFNNEDIKDSFTYSSKYKMIIPYYKDGLNNTILSTLFKKEYILNDISERIRLFYVALTRAKEKIIIVSSLKEELINNNNPLVSNDIREKYNSFLSFLLSIKNILQDYIKDINLEEYSITKDYLITKKELNNLENNIKDKIIYKEINIPNNILKKGNISKKINQVITLEEQKTLEYGTKIHQVLEMTNFLNIPKDNPYYEIINNLVNKLNITKDTIIYKEYEFIYEKEEIYHGIIDLILIQDDLVKIIDYKLKNITSLEYQKQLKIYYEYIKNNFNIQNIKVYLYSIINNDLEEIKFN